MLGVIGSKKWECQKEGHENSLIVARPKKGG